MAHAIDAGGVTMGEPQFSTGADEDLPRTLRRAKAEQAAQQQADQYGTASVQPSPAAASAKTANGVRGSGTSAPMIADGFGPEPDVYGGAAGAQTYAAPGYDGQAYGAHGYDDDRVTVTRFDVPFGRLVLFFLKAVLAAIPALILLGVLLYGGGQLLKMFFPWLVQAEILVRFPNS
ncbi:MAG: hypothetical protein AAF762_11300 [Pseudomonadota bacterium]